LLDSSIVSIHDIGNLAMLLSITTTCAPATDLGFLLHKHPDRHQSFDLSFGTAHVFYPEANAERCTACLLLDVDPVRLVRGKGDWRDGMLDQYVNDRPYVASSFMSVAISQVFGSALAGRSKEKADRVDVPFPLTVHINVLPVRGGEDLLHRIFEPLGYLVTAQRHPLDEQFPEWGDSPFFSVQLEQTITVARLLQHLYVLIPVFDLRKHYFIGQDEVEKLFAKAGDWLAEHPERELITRRYLARQPGLARQALARLVAEDLPEVLEDAIDAASEGVEMGREQTLHEQRLGAVLSVIRASDAQSVVDLGCGEGKLLRELLADKQFTSILGMDVSVRSLEIAHRRLKLDRLPSMQRERIRLHHGALTYRDEKLAGLRRELVSASLSENEQWRPGNKS
jgi:3' terminal RNA ribose 2'-O-methyltransferase Hen1